MMKRTRGASPQHLARIAGGLYLINIIGGFFAIGYIPAALIVAGDAVATMYNIQAHELLYRLGLVAHIIVLACNIPLALILYDLFKSVNRRLARFVVGFDLVGAAVEGASVVFAFAPLVLLKDNQYVAVFQAERVQMLGAVAIAEMRHVAEVTTIERAPDGVEEVGAMLSRLLSVHETIITAVRAAIEQTAQNGDGGSNDLLVGDVLRTHEQQVWFLAEHLVDTPLLRA